MSKEKREMGMRLCVLLLIGVFLSQFWGGNAETMGRKPNNETGINEAEIELEVSTGTFNKFELINVTLLTDVGVYYTTPRWSPDGMKIAFTGTKYRGIYIMNSDGTGEIVELTDNWGAGHMFSWSPNSEKIAFRDEQGIKIIHVDAKEIKLIREKEEFTDLSGPRWLHTGDIFYITIDTREGEAEKFKYKFIFCDTEGKIKKEQQVNIRGGNPSPDLKKIVFLEPQVKGKDVTFDNTKIWISDIDGQNLKILDKGSYICPLWAPDSKKISVSGNGGKEIYLFHVGTGKKLCLGEGFPYDWSPDSKYVLYNITRDDGHYLIASDIYLIKWNGTEKTQLTHTENLIEEYPSFSPDGNKIAYSTTDGRIFVATLRKMGDEK